MTGALNVFFASFVSAGGGANPTPAVDYLVVAGGGSGGSGTGGGGGGAGGLLESSAYPVTAGIAYTVTVGAGGASTTYNSPVAENGLPGNNSSFGPAITATGGGAGVIGGVPDGGSGGSGGGAGTSPGADGGPGTPGQGNNGADVQDPFPGLSIGGGGGGAGAAATNRNGGAGAASPITGTPVNYAGGGGAGVYNGTSTPSVGGIGGGGDGGYNTNAIGDGEPGDANTGGGGGGGGGTAPAAAVDVVSGAGGSGIVVVRYPDTYDDAVSTTGSPTFTTTGGYKIYKFTGDGSITF